MARDRRPDDDDEDDTPRRRRDDDRDDEDRPRRRSSRDSDDSSSAKKLNVCGLIGLILGIPSLIVTFFPCCGWIALPGVIASLILGIVGMVLAKGSNGRMGGGLAVASLVLGAIGLVISIVWLVFFSVAAVTAPTLPTVGGSTGNPVSAADPVGATVTAAEMALEFKNNSATADAKYRGKVVEVTGVIDSVSPGGEILETSLQLKGQGLTYIDCDFGTGRKSAVDGLKSGQTVTVRGRYAGQLLGDPKLTDCIIMPVKGGDGANKGPGDGAQKINASALAKAFKDNAVGANAKYADKMLEVSGQVYKMDTGRPETWYVTLGKDKKDVECRFKSGAAGVLPLELTNAVTIRGKCTGDEDGIVILEECTLVK